MKYEDAYMDELVAADWHWEGLTFAWYNWWKYIVPLTMFVAGCQSSTQTAIEANEPPAVAFIIAAQRGHDIKPAPAAVFYSQ